MKQQITIYKSIKFFLLSLLSFSLMGCGGDSTTSGIKDTTSPIITLKGNTTTSVDIGNTYSDAGATATDDVDGDLSKNIVIGGDTVDTTKAGKYTITYDVSDKSKNKAIQVSRIVQVVRFSWEHGNLKVSENKRTLQHEDGTGFFWMADTAWDLYLKSEKDIELYLTDRAEKKFTVIQTLGMHSHWTHLPEDVYVNEEYPFKRAGKTSPNEIYWKHIDYMISKAEEKGLYVALFPVWHHAIVNGTFTNPEEASTFGTWIATRYKDRKNIIWVVGGDTRANGTRVPAGMTEIEEVAIWNALGTAINSVDSKHLITFHPLGTIPSVIFSNPKWLDFNMLQSGRGSTNSSVAHVQTGLDKELAVVDGESLYENFALVENGGKADRRTAYQIRDDAYSKIFAGAFGNTYGHDSIFRFWESTEPAKDDSGNWARTPNMTWKAALNSLGGVQMKYVTELMQSRPIVGRIPDQALIVGAPLATDLSGIVATRGVGYAMIYTPHGEDINVQLGKVSGAEVKAWWYNPKDGMVTSIGEFENSGTHIFETPGEPTTKPANITSLVQSGNDWILVLDDKSKGFKEPGK